jgi:UDP-N-acetylmuramate--alanine ligase
LGERQGVLVVDDYAHHPTEIKATLAAARARYAEGEVWAVFQPHTYSRIRTLRAAYAHAFGDADHVLVTDVFAAREQPDGVVSGVWLADRIEHPDVRYVSGFEAAVSALTRGVRPGDVVVTLSAGDANRVGRDLLNVLGEVEKGSEDA